MKQADREAVRYPGLEDRRVLVTGASSGLGEHFAKVFAGQGSHVFVAARREEKVEGLASRIISAGGRATALRLDVSSSQSVSETLANLDLDVVINNAGTTVSKSALDHSGTEIDTIIDTNLKGVFHVAKAAAASMVARDIEGSIINVASILGHRVAGHASAYAASKAAVLQLTRALALEWARKGVRVNALSPGYIETELNRDIFSSDAGKALIRRVPQRKLGQPEDLDGPILLLASDLGRFMTGADIAVDGGHLVSSL